MPKLVPFARLLGPKGLMPNPKNGTLVADIKKAKSFSTGAVTLKTEKEAPLIHTVIGKNSQKDEEIIENAEAVLKALGGSKQIVKAYMKSTMSPSIRLQI
jgi:large subunit ribosomal protein L1